MKELLIITDYPKNSGIAALAAQTKQYACTFADSDEKAIEIVHRQSFDLVIVDLTRTDISHKKLFAVLPIILPGAELLGYEGEPAARFTGIVQSVFARKKAERIRRLMVLDATAGNGWEQLPPFSSN